MAGKRAAFDCDALGSQVWLEPMTMAGKRYDISDFGLSNIWLSLATPTPAVG
jgi:hypothetical protein